MPDNNFVNVMLISGNINYFNRIIKKYDTLAEYQALGSYYTTTLNFDPGNNLTTNLIIGSTSVNALTFDCNYLLVYTTTNNTTTIQQRWWVMDQKRTRAGQYTLSLKRDVIADFYDIIVDSPCFIEKATIRDSNSPLLFNREDMTLNQIKRQEVLLQDETKMAWIVGYIARNYNGTEITTIADVRTDYNESTLPVTPNATYKGATAIELYLPFRINFQYQLVTRASYQANNKLQFANSSFAQANASKGAFNYVLNNAIDYVYYKNYNNPTPTQTEEALTQNQDFINLVGGAISSNAENCQSDFESQFGLKSPSEMMDIANLEGKTYHDTNAGKYYKIHVVASSSQKTVRLQSSSAFGARIDSAIKIPVNNDTVSLTPNYTSISGYTQIDYVEQSLTINLEEFTPTSLKYTIPDTRNRLIDAPYDLFAIPYPLKPAYVMEAYTSDDNYELFQINKVNSLNIAQGIGQALGTNLYDIQILPYCPITNLMKDYLIDGDPEPVNLIGLGSLTSGKDYTIVKDNSNNKLGLILYGTSSGRTFDIPYQIVVTNPKVDNETKMYRLVSPNYSGMFEFSPAMNGGVDYFNVDITYKPYQPYIHVNPNFKHMYGKDFNDSRGLICGGDYSVAIISDKWAEFQINNKNYQMIFDREVQNLEFTREQDRIKQVVGGLVGTVQGAAQGGMSGGWAGAIVGGAASAAGGVADIIMEEQKYKENLSLKKDLYGYNLGNIKALPYSLTKSMSLNENFKFWPFLEQYECSFEELSAFLAKIQYDGMTVMKIDKMKNYIVASSKSFIKGQMIRLENLPEAADVAYEIFNEIKRGVYI